MATTPRDASNLSLLPEVTSRSINKNDYSLHDPGDSSLGSGWTTQLKQKQLVKLDHCPQSRGWNNWKKKDMKRQHRSYRNDSPAVSAGWPSNHGYSHSHLLQIHGSGNILSSCSCKCRNKKEEGGALSQENYPPGSTNIPFLGKDKSSTQKCRLGWDIFSSQDTLWDQQIAL